MENLCTPVGLLHLKRRDTALACLSPAQSFEEGACGQIAREVEGKVIAVDLSFWVVQASTQPALQELFRNSPSEACLKVVFERVRLQTPAVLKVLLYL